MKNRKISTTWEIGYFEFPELLFATAEDGTVYFDATDYIRKKRREKKESLVDFQTDFAFWIRAVGEAYGIEVEEMTARDEKSGHTLMEEALSLLFIAWLDPGFAVYMLERMSEMLLRGFVLSDTSLVAMAGERLSNSDLKLIIEKR
jgi:hypothetical protein